VSLIDQDGYAATLYRELDPREPFATIEGPFSGVINSHITLVTRLTLQDARNLAAHLIEAAVRG